MRKRNGARRVLAMGLSLAFALDGLPYQAIAEALEEASAADVVLAEEAEGVPETLEDSVRSLAEGVRDACEADGSEVTQEALIRGLCERLAQCEVTADAELELENAARTALQGEATTSEGLARAFELVSEELGIECRVLVGADGSVWDCVKIDEAWLHVDVAQGVVLASDEELAERFPERNPWREVDTEELSAESGIADEEALEEPAEEPVAEEPTVEEPAEEPLSEEPGDETIEQEEPTVEAPEAEPEESTEVTPEDEPATAPLEEPAPEFDEELTQILTEGIVSDQPLEVLEDTEESLTTQAGDYTTETYGNGVKITDYSGSGGKISIPSKINGKNVVAIGEMAFFEKGLTEVTIPNTVKEIQMGAFGAEENNGTLTKVTLGTGVETIGDYAFQFQNFEQISIPKNVKSLGEFPFFRCYKLRVIDVATSNTSFASVDGVLFDKAIKKLVLYPSAKTGKSYAVPTTVTTIGDGAFASQAYLEAVTIPSSVKTIGERAFRATKLKSVTVPKSVTFVGIGAFDNCHDLVSLTYASSADIPSRFCTFCSSLKTLSLTGSFKVIGERAFRGCSRLTNVKIPESVTIIDSMAFYECQSLTSINIPASVKEVQYAAFDGCAKLSTVTGCKGLVSIEEFAFGETAISSFPFGKNLRYVSYLAFYECPNYARPEYPTYMAKDEIGNYRVYDDVLMVPGTSCYDLASEVLNLVNKERAKVGAAPLVMDKSLQASAMQRAAEASLYFEHTRPDGTDCFGANAKMSGENIAAGSSTAKDVMDQWMNSALHKANILSSSYKSIGIGCFKMSGSTAYWTQCFSGESGSNTNAGSGKKTSSYKVNVNYDTISLKGSGFSISENNTEPIPLLKGETSNLVLRLKNGGWDAAYCVIGSSCLNWRSSNTSVATVSAKGVVTGVKAGNATITATSKGGKSWSIKFKVKPTLKEAKVSAIVDRTFNFQWQKPKPTVTLGGKTLKEGVDYDCHYSDNHNAGIASIQIYGRGNYGGEKTVTFTIKPADIAKAEAGVNYCYYTGKACEPEFYVSFNDYWVSEGEEYTFSYSDNVKVGWGKLTLKGRGNFTGAKTVGFRIWFSDVNETNPLSEKIHRAADKKVLSGYSGKNYGKFGPFDNITRGQIAVMLWNVAGHPSVKAGARTFPDVKSGAYYYNAVRWAASVGVVNGYANGKFGPNDNITREQLAVMIANYAKKIGKQMVSGSRADLAQAYDDGEVSNYAVSSLAWCYKKGIFMLDNNWIWPSTTAYRQTAAQMAIDLYDLLH